MTLSSDLLTSKWSRGSPVSWASLLPISSLLRHSVLDLGLTIRDRQTVRSDGQRSSFHNAPTLWGRCIIVHVPWEGEWMTAYKNATPHMCYHTKFRRSSWAKPLGRIGFPKILWKAGAPPWDGGTADPVKHEPTSHIC